MLSCTQELIVRNPEHYTAWNERKRALNLSLKQPISKETLKKELMINVLAIRSNPKSYSAWYHRRWFLETFCKEKKNEILGEELKLLAQLLDLDCRNCIFML